MVYVNVTYLKTHFSKRRGIFEIRTQQRTECHNLANKAALYTAESGLRSPFFRAIWPALESVDN